LRESPPLIRWRRFGPRDASPLLARDRCMRARRIARR